MPGASIAFESTGLAVARDISEGPRTLTLFRPRATTVTSADRLKTAINRVQQDPPPRLLQPANSTSRVIAARTHHWLFFRPAVYQLTTEVEYSIGKLRCIDTYPSSLTVRAAVASNVIGALVGSVAGWLVGQGAHLQTSFDVASLVVTAVSGAVAAVLLARRREAQSFVTVEDFWGAFVLGFLVGFSGPKLLQTLLPTGGTK